MRAHLLYGCDWGAALLLTIASGGHRALGSPAAAPSLCKSSDIQAKDLSNCDCPSSYPPANQLVCLTKTPQPHKCSYACTPPPPSPAMSSAELVAWGSGCIDGCADANNNCNGCYLWFHSLCGCIKDLQQPHPQSNCLYFGQITPHSTTPAWVVMNQRDKLTTTERVPGILQVQQNKLYQDGFAFAQKTVDNMYKADGTLALNAVAHRQEEQIHIHLCNNGAKSKVRAVLDGKHPGDYKSLKTVDLSSVNKAYAMWCRAGQAKPIDMAKDIVDYLGKQVGKNDCARYRVGAGFMVSKGYAWSCVTTAGVAEDIFCKS